MTLEKLQPAQAKDVHVYVPYYQGNKRNALPLAISLYRQGSLEGTRIIEGGESIPFVASWSVSSLPADLTRFRMQFDGNAELSYEITMANFEFVSYLIELLFSFKRSRLVDFSQAFYRKLLRLDD
ncbi:MAG: hypothetical protein IGR80_12150 [Synechococcales cyanobacterium K44_A2020_017]|jgi:hypothetical protein|uniref:type IV pilus biogenesis protein EbsA n=1 Tax=Leptolyngbya sp. CCY15150 TaxID=2767772 RepID=UPI00194E31F8|nr:type IV pilus biogenesis protein EbsA [Leptolyngbya sp. CCY15150]MBF2089352.1 hypothetical protein [Synechococcales cyanobacterium K32_A2020_035]MBF2095497.1 hypothetical protein [Synechococcales cyanobacterium K44_A2020_017]